VIALRGLGEGIKRKFVLLRFYGIQVKVEIVDVDALTHQALSGPQGFVLL
jgi:hypothetical protein